MLGGLCAGHVHGTHDGRIHAVAPVDQVPVAIEIDALTMLSSQAGARIGMLRTMVRTHE